MIFRASDRRSDIDKAYSKMIHVMFDHIERVAYEHDKIPPEIIMFGKFLIEALNNCILAAIYFFNFLLLLLTA